MTSIRLAIASLLAAGAVLAGAAGVQHSAAASASHKTVVAGIIDCCDGMNAVK
jgi:type IV secretory pathway VirB2 component (pilin)